MSKKNPEEHLKTYERFCAPRFQSLEDRFTKTDGKVDDLNAIVTNGLKDKIADVIKQIDKLDIRFNWLLGILISLLLLIIGSTLTLYATNQYRYEQLTKQIKEYNLEISN